MRDRLTSTAVDLGTPGRDQYFGYGRVDASRALYSVFVSMSGPIFIQTGTFTWTASASGGEPPYEYHWLRRNYCDTYEQEVSTSDTYTEDLVAGQSTFFLTVTVTSVGQTVSASKKVGPPMTCDP